MSRISFQDSSYRQPGYQTRFGTKQKEKNSVFLMENIQIQQGDMSASKKLNMHDKDISVRNTKEVVEQYQEKLERELFLRNRKSENKIVKKEELVSFAEEDSYDANSKAFLEILGIKMDEKINWSADGTSELTESQIKYLQEKYDIENLSKSDFYNLLAELSGMNVISQEDVRSQFLRPGNPAATEKGFVISAADEHFSQWLNSGNDYLSRFQNEERMYDYLIQALLDGKSSVQASDIFMTRSYYEARKESSGRLAEIFEKLKLV